MIMSLLCKIHIQKLLFGMLKHRKRRVYMKKAILVIGAMLLVSACTANHSNMSNEMKIDNPVDLSKEDGADHVERLGDHQDSLYYRHPDFYNMKSTETRTILPHFQTIQQSAEWSCGVDSALMVLNYYGKLKDHTEETLAKFRTNQLAEEATSLKSMIQIFEGVGGMTIHSTYDYTKEEAMEQVNLQMIRDYLKRGVPVIVAWNDWGGHWQTIIGYDDMGTETTQDDVLIVADSYDTTDHNQDGYGIIPAERFYYNWTMFDFFEKHYQIDERDRLFIAVELNEQTNQNQ